MTNLLRGIDARLINPRQAHEKAILRARGGKALRDLDDDIRRTADALHQPAADRPRVFGSTSDQSLLLSLVDELVALGVIDAGFIDIAPPLPHVFEHNAPIHTRGVAPSMALGAAGQVGTGSPTITPNDATDVSGRITLVTGATGALSAGVLGTVTFAVPRQNGDYGVALWPADGDANGRPVFSDFGTRATTSWTFQCSTALANGTSYHWEYLVVDRTSL